MFPPLVLHLYSSNESMQFLRYDKQRKLYLYAYTVSNTKLGLTTPHTEEWLKKLIEIQNIFKPVEWFDTNFEL